ncbi:class-I pyridine nucleotide-disulfide oxidoreductase-like protein [Sorochytrium milnesiophthora]
MATSVIQSLVRKAIADNAVMARSPLFSHSFLAYCKKTKALFDDMNVRYSAMELDLREDGQQIQSHLAEISKQKTVPNIFINGQHVGGNSDLEAMKDSGKLLDLLQQRLAWVIDATMLRQVKTHKYDYDMVVIGGGSGAAKFGKKVAVLDYIKPTPLGTKWDIGGTCVNVGCVPKKMMHMASLLGVSLQDAVKSGWQIPGAEHATQNGTGEHKPLFKHSWHQMIEGVQKHIHNINSNYKVALKHERVEYINAYGEFVDPHTIRLSRFNSETDALEKQETITADKVVIAVGGRPRYLGIPNDRELCITSDDLFSLKKEPGKTLVIGASYVSLESAGFLNHFGYDVTVMVRSVFLRGYDQEMAGKIVDYMRNHGTKFISHAVPTALNKLPSGRIQVEYKLTEEGRTVTDEFDTVMLAIGRDPITKPLNLEAAGVKYNAETFKIPVAPDDRTNVDNVFAVGDVVEGRYELTPVAVHTGRLLARRLFGNGTDLLEHRVIPTTVFTPLEYGAIGYSEEDAIQKWGEDDIEVWQTSFRPLEWALPNRERNACFTKLVCVKSDRMRVVGMHFLGPNAGEVTQGYVVGMRLGATKADFDNSMCIHPTISEEVLRIKDTKRYNMFMKKELAKVKVDHPTLSHKEAFKRAASNWADSSDNPKNKAK